MLDEEEKLFLCYLCHRYMKEQLNPAFNRIPSNSIMSFDEVMEIVRKISEEDNLQKKSQT